MYARNSATITSISGQYSGLFSNSHFKNIYNAVLSVININFKELKESPMSFKANNEQ